MARARDRDRYKNNPKRFEYICTWTKNKTKRYQMENPNRIKYHERCYKIINKL